MNVFAGVDIQTGANTNQELEHSAERSIFLRLLVWLPLVYVFGQFIAVIPQTRYPRVFAT